MLEITLLGQFKVALDGVTLTANSRPLQLLLAYLAINGDQTIQRDKLAGVLWPDSSESTARKNLRNYIWRLRKLIGEAYLDAAKHTVSFSPGAPYQLDTETLTQVSLDDPPEDLIRAISVYTGELLPGFYENWVQLERERLQALFERQMGALLDQLERAARWSELTSWAEHWISFGGVPEPAYRALMIGHAALGDLSAAAAAYQRCVKALAAELGVEPSRETISLFQQIERGELQVAAGEMIPLAKETIVLDQLQRKRSVQEGSQVFVGREKELRQLLATLGTTHTGRGQVQFIIGGAGRGKSALTAAFIDQAQQAHPGLLVFGGYCHSHAGITDPYAPFRQALTQLTGDITSWAGSVLANDEQEARLLQAMPLTIPALVTQGPDLINTLIPGEELRRRAESFARQDAPWYRRLLRQLDSPFQDNLRQNRLFSQVTAVLKHIARGRPLLFVIEDLHWLDTASTSLLFHLSRAIGDSPILLLGTYRPEEVAIGWEGRKHPLAHITGELKRQHGDVWLDLGEIAAEEGRAFVDAYLDSEPNEFDEEFRQSLFTRTGGHALFTIELLRTMQEKGTLYRNEAGVWQTGEAIDWHDLPAKIEGVIEQRLGQLQPDMQHSLAVASVEGDAFTAEVVARVQAMDDRQLVRRLSDDLDRRHRLVRAEALAWAGEQRLSRYRFRHQLFQQYLYDRMSDSERTYLHEEVGQTLEAIYAQGADQVAAQLAWQFENAGLTEKAIDYLIIAGRQAARVGANHELIEHCQRGMKLLLTLPFSPQTVKQGLILQMSLGGGLMATKGYADEETLAAFKRARELCRVAGDAPQLFPILRGIWAFHFARAEYRAACELGESQLALSKDEPASSPHLNACWMLGITLFHQGQYSTALGHLEHVIATYDPAKHHSLNLPNGIDLRVSAWSCSALCQAMLGYPDRAFAYSQKGLMLARQLDHPLTLAFALVYATFLRLSRPDASSTQEMFEECLALTAAHGFVIYQVPETIWHHYVQGLKGEPAKAAGAMRAGLAAWREAGAEFLITDFLCKLAEITALAGQPEDAFAYLDDAKAYAQKNDERYMEPEIYCLEGRLHWRIQGDEAAAEESLRKAVAIAQDQQARLPELRAATELCRLWGAQGKSDEAHSMLAGIYDWFSEGAAEPDLVVAKQLLQELASD